MTYSNTKQPLVEATPTVMQVHFWGDVKTSAGSVEKIILSFAKYMTRYRPVVVSRDDIGGQKVDGNICFYGFSEDFLKNKIFNKIFRLGVFTFDSLISIIQAERPVILHFHNRHDLVDIILSKLDYRPKVIAQYHRHFNELHIPNRCDLILAVSRDLQTYLIEKARTKLPIAVLHNPVADPDSLMETANEVNSPPILLYAGGRQSHKGFDDLMAAIERGQDTLGSNFELHLAGPNLEGFIPPFPNIQNLGCLSSQAYYAALRRADVVIMPSRYEAFGMVALEAMHLGKILVVSHAGGLSEFVNERNAILIEPNSPESLLVGIVRALKLANSKESELADMRHAAREKSNEFSPKYVVQKLEAIYDKVLGS